ncbi:hypothetical protein RISK_004584 [Rhodopirellula islandica]|uniref:Uncharacterized protein n=1 Tax=Rhodopirellula islandica TaxID=595434 RepID=A0A0J1B979_RHOIS|nr:hypothetical protein RISK_004584 [Rhodopirellula islandica]
MVRVSAKKTASDTFMMLRESQVDARHDGKFKEVALEERT